MTGTTSPGASVDIGSADTTTGAAASVTSTVAAADGSFSASVPVGFGDNVITATSTSPDGRSTGYAQVSVVGDVTSGTTVLNVTDPAGDDNGPGTYQYPTASDFHAGAFDLTDFQVISDGTTAYLRATLANLDPTFGSDFGAQLLDVYVHTPGASATSTQAAYASRNYTIAPGRGLERAGRGPGLRVSQPGWTPAGTRSGTAFMLTDDANRTVTIALPGGPVRHAGVRLGVQRRADRAGRVQLRSGPGVHGDPAGPSRFGVCADRRDEPDLPGGPVDRPQGHGRHHPHRRVAGHRTRPHPGPVVIQPVTVP